MNNIYVLTVDTEEDNFDMYFTTLDKAQEFIVNNFEYDKPRRLTDDHYEGKTNLYIIKDHSVNQVSF